MKRSKRMEPIHRLANERASELARAYAAHRERLSQEAERIEQLRGFRREYAQKLAVSGGQGIDAYRLRDYNAFLGRIDQAICQQQQCLERLEAEVEEMRLSWLDQWGSAQALEQLVGRYRRAEQHADAVRDQRLNDALAQRPTGPENSQ